MAEENRFSSGYVQAGFVRENRFVVHGETTRFHAVAKSNGRHIVALVNAHESVQMSLNDKDLDALTDWLIERRATIKRENDAVDALMAVIPELKTKPRIARMVINAGMEHAI